MQYMDQADAQFSITAEDKAWENAYAEFAIGTIKLEEVCLTSIATLQKR